MSNVVPFNRANLPPAVLAAFNAETAKQELSGGVLPSFAVLSIRGKAWRIGYKGQQQAMQKDGEPITSLQLVLLRSSPALSKIFYEKPYEEGSDQPPDCYSNDSIKPAQDASNKQAATCAECPMNVWGSKITPEGKKARACADNRRIAVVPAGNIANERFGGPMLLRVPPASLQDLASYSDMLEHDGWPYFAVATRVGFDIEASYPKLTFRPAKELTPEEALLALELRNSDQTYRVLGEVATREAPKEAPKEAPREAPREAPKEAIQPTDDPGLSLEGFGTETEATVPASQVEAAKPAAETQTVEAQEPTEAGGTAEKVDAMLGDLLDGFGGSPAA